nr:uncharacterized protein CTRU02_15326 [Colletotrichum truncatum]KAF6781171.1 hypothetical protein CTRU02_15326 [Colletotrichum truncatum]
MKAYCSTAARNIHSPNCYKLLLQRIAPRQTDELLQSTSTQDRAHCVVITSLASLGHHSVQAFPASPPEAFPSARPPVIFSPGEISLRDPTSGNSQLWSTGSNS